MGLRAVQARVPRDGSAGVIEAFELDRAGAELALHADRIAAVYAEAEAGLPDELGELIADCRGRLAEARERAVLAADGEVAPDGVGHPVAEGVGDEGVADRDLGDAGDDA